MTRLLRGIIVTWGEHCCGGNPGRCPSEEYRGHPSEEYHTVPSGENIARVALYSVAEAAI